MYMMYLYISSKDSIDLYPQNTPANFIVQLPQHLQLDEGTWTCGVLQCVLPSTPRSATYITCDFVESSFLGGHAQPVLAMTTVKTKEYVNVTRVPIKRTQLPTIRIKLVNRRGVSPTLEIGETLLVLEIRHG